MDQNSTIQTISHTKSSRIDIANQTNLTLVDAFEIPQGQAMELQGSGGGTIDISDNITLSGILKLNAEDNIISRGKVVFNDGMLDLDKDASIASEIILNDNASMDLSSGKKLSVTQSFEVPANLKLEIVGTDGGFLSLSDNLTIAGIIQFSPPTVSSQTQYHSMIDGTIELVAGSLLDVDYHTNIASNIKISGDSTIDVAPDMTLTYSGDAIDVKSYQLTFLGTGTLLNSNAVLLSNSEGLIVFADDITVALVRVEAGSSSGKGIKVKSSGAKVTNLNIKKRPVSAVADNIEFKNIFLEQKIEEFRSESGLNISSLSKLSEIERTYIIRHWIKKNGFSQPNRKTQLEIEKIFFCSQTTSNSSVQWSRADNAQKSCKMFTDKKSLIIKEL